MPPQKTRFQGHVEVISVPHGKLIHISAFEDVISDDSEVPFATLSTKDDVVGYIARADWSDQGWGNQKGRIGISGYVFNVISQIAPHSREVNYGAMTLSKAIPAGQDSIVLTYTVGGGGGHRISVKGASIRLFYRSYFFADFYRFLLLVQKISEKIQKDHAIVTLGPVLWARLAQLPWDVVVHVVGFLALGRVDGACERMDGANWPEWQGGPAGLVPPRMKSR